MSIVDYDFDHLGLGEPIETEMGVFTPLKVKDLHEYGADLQVVSFDERTIAYRLESAMEGMGDPQELEVMEDLVEKIRQSNLFQTVHALDIVRDSYERLFQKTMGVDNPFDTIKGREKFNYYRDLILGSSGVPKKIGHLDPEVQYAHERSEKVKNEGKEPTTITNMISILAVALQTPFADIKELTIYQFYLLYQRNILKIESEMSVQRILAGDTKATYIDWMENIDLLETDENAHFMTERSFLGFANSVLE